MESSKGINRALATVGLGVISGIVLGIITNWFNGSLSPSYFAFLFDLDTGNMPELAIAQGMMEGAMIGGVLGVVVATIVLLLTKGEANLRVNVRLLLSIVFLALSAWVIGGAIGVAIAAVSPDFYSYYGSQHESRTGVMAFAWVGGSIRGIEVGAILATLLACANFWVRHDRAVEPGSA
ncbi:MAG: hypothetical protein JNJ45_05840 [Chthonomonas sp.]|nr:hypothetical protein [Chthonomonas sp.]